MALNEERVDKWLWAMRVFKTRTISTEACKKGRVSVGKTIDTAAIAKPSREIKVGDIVHVRKPPITWSYRVKALTNNRLGAKLVPDYMENVTEKNQLDLLEMVKISGFVDRRKGLGRPTKKEGRDLLKFSDEMDVPFFDDMDDWDDDLDEDMDDGMDDDFFEDYSEG